MALVRRPKHRTVGANWLGTRHAEIGQGCRLVRAAEFFAGRACQ